MTVKTADSKGRVSLGSDFAHCQVIIEHIDEFEVRIVRARVIPEREIWLWKNPEAIKAVQTGIQQAKIGDFSGSVPDIDADWEELADVEE